MLELTSVVSEVTVAETRSFLETAKDNTHGAAVVTMLQDSRGDKNINITNSHRRLRLSSTAMCEVLRTRTSLDWSFTVAGPHLFTTHTSPPTWLWTYSLGACPVTEDAAVIIYYVNHTKVHEK